MASYAEDVIKIAQEQVGYMEKASPKDLDSKTANSGYNNYTKYSGENIEEMMLQTYFLCIHPLQKKNGQYHGRPCV